MNNIQLAILSFEAIVVALLVLFLFRVRSRFGLSPLYITLGVFQPIQTILTSTFYVEVMPGVIVSPGSVIMFTASLFVILLVYIFEDATETRKAIYGIMFANLTMALLLFIFSLQLGVLNTINLFNLSREIFTRNARMMLIGTSVLFLDSVLLIFIYEAVWRLLPKSLFLRIYLTMVLVLIFDSLAFTTGAFYDRPNYTTILISNITGKLVMAVFYASILTAYLRFAERSNHTTQTFKDIFQILSYRQKFEIEHQQGQQTESLLRESEGRYQTLANISPVGIFRTDMNGVTTYVNPKWCEISGMPFDDALGDGWLDAVHPDDKEKVKNGWKTSTELRRPSSSDYRFIRPDGTTAWVMGQAVPETTSDGQILGYIGTITDITERKKAEEALQASEKRFRSLIENSSDEISIISPDGTLLYESPSAIPTLGYSMGAFLGKSLFQLVHPDDSERVQQELKSLLQGPHLHPRIRFRLLHNSKTWRWIEAVGTNLLDEPTVKGIVINYHDVTEQVRADELIQRQLKWLNGLHMIDIAISSSFDLNTTLNIILQQVVLQLEIDACAILLFNPQLQTVKYLASRGFKSRAIQHTNLRLGEGYAGRVVMERRPIHVSNVMELNSGLSAALQLANEDFSDYYGMPLIVKGEVKGVMEIYHRSNLKPDNDWLEFLKTLSTQTAIAIDNAQMFDSLQRTNRELEFAYDATIEGWSHALDLRDRETEGHTQRVTEKTLILAQYMGIPDRELVHIRRGALLHDIGKMGVPDGILFKPEKLTDSEWEIMKKHPIFAYEMLSPIAYLEAALDIPYCHHEKWDGTGYPRGLRGEQIPMSARIFAVIDVWDALTSERPYRKSWTEKQTIEYIKTNSGTHFDPRVVNEFMKLIGQE